MREVPVPERTEAPADRATGSSKADRRRPRWVYRVGVEPDPRFTLANERTFLAWIRTALALMAAGVALDALVRGGNVTARKVVALSLVVLGTACGTMAYGRWMVNERALRTGRALPAPALAPVLGYGIAAIGVLACVLLIALR
jgi:inner membrane protein YidH